ncbi:MAG: ABC transporter substrate-binding protein [Asticcacaulis sp.]|uniref:ABC transporter substrate-binding protein n=1 Tax=Asticcacaulis sp. TaxID=1872648 RepID=UPI0039E6421E
MAAAVLLTAAVTLAACSPNASKPATGAVVLKVGNQKGTTRALMTASHALDGAPYTVEWSEFPAAQHLLEALNAGAVDVGLVGDAPYLFAFANGSPLKVVSAIAYGDGSSTAIVVPANSKAKSLSDLKGKRIATGKISVGHYLLLRALEKEGLTTKDVQIVFLAPADAKAAFASGSIDAWSTWAPFLTTATLQDHARVLVSGKGLMTSHAYQVATPAAIHDKTAALQDFNARLTKAYEWGNAHPQDYAAALSKDTGLPIDVAAAMLKQIAPHTVPLDASIVAEADGVVDHLSKASDTPPQKRPIADAFATEFTSR